MLHDELIELDARRSDGTADRHRISERGAYEVHREALRMGGRWGATDALVDGRATEAAVHGDGMAEQLANLLHRRRGGEKSGKL